MSIPEAIHIWELTGFQFRSKAFKAFINNTPWPYNVPTRFCRAVAPASRDTPYRWITVRTGVIRISRGQACGITMPYDALVVQFAQRIRRLID